MLRLNVAQRALPLTLPAAAAEGKVPSISVALCTHQGTKFLAEQLRSICLQTLPPDELVVSDDASSDGTVALVYQVVQECLQEHPELRIDLKVLNNAVPLRVARNFENAIRACSGDVIALSDQDDAWAADKLALMVREFVERPGLMLIHSDARLVDRDGHALGDTLFHALEVTRSELTRIHAGAAFDVFLRRNLVTGATALFRRELVDIAVPFPAGWLHDEWLGVIASAVGEVDVLERQLIDYRQHDANQIGARRDTLREKIDKALAPRGDTHVVRARKAADLLARLKSFGGNVDAALVRKVDGKLEHQQFRATLPESRLQRVWPILREAVSGRYGEYGRGVRGVVRDLFESV